MAMNSLNMFKSSSLSAGVLISVVSFFALTKPLAAESKAYAETLAKEYQLKAAFMYNFAKFVEWPSRTNEEIGKVFVIGIFGFDPFGEDIDELLANKTVNERKIEVRRFRAINEIMPCHILFINSSEVRGLSDIIRRLDGTSTLTVSDTSSFISHGGMINFVMEENSVRFIINKMATDRAGLKISSQLLKLARSVMS